VLLRFWGLESGTARLGGTALDQLPQDRVRSRIGWVGQDAHLFPTTIGGNIAVARPGASAADIAEAARRAQLGPWIDSLPDGMDTPVGERGARLSGGQRQRVALARALLAGSRVLVLDEPTSGLDRPTARRLVDDVVTASEGTSVVYITHRDEELAGFDDVAVVDAGRVVATSRRDG
jgi:ABC-type multidrug transport system fused ATPase/permease subunit